MVIVIIHLTTECLLLMFKLYCSSWRTFATTHAVPPPGHLPGHKHKALSVQSDVTKRSVYRQYVKAWSDGGSHIHISWAKFTLWLELVTDIRAIKPGTKLCFECRQNFNVIFKSANLPEDEN